MKLLLDTHTFLWWDSEPERLSPTVMALCRDPANALLLSVASIWEIQVKSQLGKLELKRPVAEIIRDQRRANQLRILPIWLKHVLTLGELPSHHRDPFDRLLVCQARVEGAVLLTRDRLIGQYDVDVRW
ncbi:MAG: type II toxin-antitoxin system VapC family toxin [Candidatus Promineofilum sp.]|nr:type II toxin-antitoxin system VapC family toxin [Promineifilum sp.]